MADPVDRLNAALGTRYVVQREIGSGGMATVYLAQDVKHDRDVAIKVMRPELSAILGRERFLREIRIAARLNHPHIVSLFDSGDVDGVLYYVMPYIEGKSLRERLTEVGPLGTEEALAITRQVAGALDYAHGQGVIHRDVKPENVLLHHSEALVVDFGIALAIAAAADRRLTGLDGIVGTPEYMSPEQAMGEDTVDARADLYALACVLHEMLAGEPPYTGRNAHAIIAKRLTNPVPSIRRVRGEVPVAVERALLMALASAADDRFPTVDAFAQALEAPVFAPVVTVPLEQSVAVLPFLNLSPDPENEYFVDGVTEDVIAQLAKIGDLKVISRSSVMRFKSGEEELRKIGHALGVETILEGSVRWAGDRVRIVAELVDVETDQHLWAETYDRELRDIFAIQSEVAVRIAEALRTELSPDERARLQERPRASVDAYQLYLKGKRCRDRMTNEGLHNALEYYREAIGRDPDFALPYLGAGIAYLSLGMGYGPRAMMPEEAYAEAKAVVTRGLELDDHLGEAHSALGLVKCIADFDWPGAEQAFRRAMELSPGSADIYDQFGLMLSAMDRHDEAIAVRRRAQELDPLSAIVASDLATTLLRAGRYDEALQEARRLLDLEPSIPLAHSTLGWAHVMRGEYEAGVAELTEAAELASGNTMFPAQLAQGLAMAGRTREARRILRRLEKMAREGYVPPYHLAYVHTGLGEEDAAMDCLERAYEERAGGIYGVKGSFLFASLRNHPRFDALLAKIGLG